MHGRAEIRMIFLRVLKVYVVVNFLSYIIFIFSLFVSTSLAYITIPKKQKKNKNYLDKKLTATYIFNEWASRERVWVKYIFHEKRNFVTPSSHVMYYLSYKHQWNTKPFHFNIFFATMIFLRVKVLNMSSRESSPVISLVFI